MSACCSMRLSISLASAAAIAPRSDYSVSVQVVSAAGWNGRCRLGFLDAGFETSVGGHDKCAVTGSVIITGL